MDETLAAEAAAPDPLRTDVRWLLLGASTIALGLALPGPLGCVAALGGIAVGRSLGGLLEQACRERRETDRAGGEP